MNILLINHYAGSPEHGMEFRPYYLAREWTAAGHDVRIVASTYSHLRRQQPAADGPITRQQLDGVNYEWLRTRPYQGNGIPRLLNMMQFTGTLYRERKRLAAWRPDVVIASSTYPYDIWPAAAIARAAGAKLVFEVHDLWPLTPQLIGGFSRWHPMIATMQWAEDYACRHADAVVSILPGTEPHLRERGLPAGKFTYVPNGYDPGAPATPVPEALRQEIEAFRSRHDALCIYAGGHALSNALGDLLDAAARPEVARVGFVLVGGGVDKPRLQKMARERGLTNVLFGDPVSKTAVPGLLALADMAYIGWLRSPLYEFGISPNKLFDYMLAGLPVVHATDTPFDPVRDAGCGITVPPASPVDVAQAVARLAALPPAERQALGERGRRYVEQRHAYPVLAQQFLQAAHPGLS